MNLKNYLQSESWKSIQLSPSLKNNRCFICRVFKSDKSLSLIYWSDVFTGEVYGIDYALLCYDCALLNRSQSMRNWRHKYCIEHSQTSRKKSYRKKQERKFKKYQKLKLNSKIKGTEYYGIWHEQIG